MTSNSTTAATAPTMMPMGTDSDELDQKKISDYSKSMTILETADTIHCDSVGSEVHYYCLTAYCLLGTN